MREYRAASGEWVAERGGYLFAFYCEEDRTTFCELWDDDAREATIFWGELSSVGEAADGRCRFEGLSL